MNLYYLLGTVGNRLVGLASILALAVLLSPVDFGIFTLSVSVALFTNILLAWWMNSAAYRYIQSNHDDESKRSISTLLGAAIFVGIVVFALDAGIMALFLNKTWGAAILTGILGLALMMFDLTLAANNALGQARAYASLSVVRNLAVFGLASSAAIFQLGVGGVLIAYCIGTVLPMAIIHSSSRFWGLASIARFSRPHLLRMAKFGFAGALSLGVYMLIQAPGRMAMDLNVGPAYAGYYALALDIAFAPIVLLGTSYSLSRIKGIFQNTGENQDVAVREVSHQFEVFFLFVVPYASILGMIAPEISYFFVNSQSASSITSIAIPALIQAGLIALGSCIASALLVTGRSRVMVLFLLVLAIGNALTIGLSAAESFAHVVWMSTGFLSLVVALGAVTAAYDNSIKFRLLWLAKIVSSGLAACLACWSLIAFVPVFGLAIGLIAAPVCYLVLLQRFGGVDWLVFIRSFGMSFSD